jgi:hypothetical protein
MKVIVQSQNENFGKNFRILLENWNLYSYNWNKFKTFLSSTHVRKVNIKGKKRNNWRKKKKSHRNSLLTYSTEKSKITKQQRRQRKINKQEQNPSPVLLRWFALFDETNSAAVAYSGPHNPYCASTDLSISSFVWREGMCWPTRTPRGRNRKSNE